MAEQICEVCEKPTTDFLVHPEDGGSYCWRCTADLLGAERDALRFRLGRYEAALRFYANTHIYDDHWAPVGDDGEPEKGAVARTARAREEGVIE